MPIAVVADVDTASPIIYYVHVDHLNRPVMMTDGLKVNVWEAVWLPYGAAHSITGAAANDTRFPGQWFQIETGLHYNWHRHYDPTLARYTQPDPLGFVDGPSVFAYALNSPQVYVDRDGRYIFVPFVVGVLVGGGVDYGLQYLNAYLNNQCFVWNWKQTVATSFAAGLGGGFGGFFGSLGLKALPEIALNVIANAYIGAAFSDITGSDKIIGTGFGALGGFAGAAAGRAIANVFRGIGSGIGQGVSAGVTEVGSQIISNTVSGSGGLIGN